MGNRRWISVVILAASIPIYAGLCWPAITRRGFPEIDPFWLAMPWLWVAPIVLSRLFDVSKPVRKWSLGIYTLLTAFIFAGTFVSVVPHHPSIAGTVLGTVFLWGPVNLLIAFVVEKISQCFLKPFCAWGNTTPNDTTTDHPVRAGAVFVVILGLAVAFPFACRKIVFRAAQSSGQSDAERDWANGQAICFVRRDEPEAFGAPGGCYGVENGLRIEAIRPGVTKAIYCNAYREVVTREFAQHGPANKIRDLCTQAELQTWVKEGRFHRAEAIPLKHGAAEISPRGYNIKGASYHPICVRGEPSRFFYYTILPEKKNALAVITDDSIWIFDKTGELLQLVEFSWYRQMGISEDVLLAHH